MNIFENLESQVRRYCRSFPTVFTTAQGYTITDENGRNYIDFFCGSGSLNYGHNHPVMKQKLLEYISENGIVQSLDMATVSKREFIKQFYEIILKPRHLDYKVQFTGPTGTNAVEAALKLARKFKKRKPIVSFTNSFHGMTLGALSVSFNAMKYTDISAVHSVAMPFDGFFGKNCDTLNYIEKFLKISKSKSELPAAFILETVQCDGGVNVAGFEWLSELEKLVRQYDILLIIDDIQAGCGRTGSFFSFEPSGIVPDMICLSKSLSGYGLPLSVVLIKPELDIWQPGEHSGTFRGNNLAFVTAVSALSFWKDNTFSESINMKSIQIHNRLTALAGKYPHVVMNVRGRGLVWGIEFDKRIAGQIAQEIFKQGMLIETCGSENNVLKLMPPLITDGEGLDSGLDIIEQAFVKTSGVKV